MFGGTTKGVRRCTIFNLKNCLIPPLAKNLPDDEEEIMAEPHLPGFVIFIL